MYHPLSLLEWQEIPVWLPKTWSAKDAVVLFATCEEVVRFKMPQESSSSRKHGNRKDGAYDAQGQAFLFSVCFRFVYSRVYLVCCSAVTESTVDM